MGAERRNEWKCVSGPLGAVPQADRLVSKSQGSTGRRKTGRPLAYTGDPDSPALSDADKRKIKRRIANRESARRIRNRQLQKTEALMTEVRRPAPALL